MWDQNPADVGSRGTLSRERPEIWLKGPNWLSKPQNVASGGAD